MTKKEKENTFRGLLIIFLYFMLTIFFSIIHSVIKTNNLSIDSFLLTIETLAVSLIIILMSCKRLNGEFRRFKKNFKPIVKTSLKCWISGFILMYIANLILYYFVMGGIAPNEEANRTILTTYQLYSIISMCLIGPITEEILFRLNFKGSFTKKSSYILFTGILFGAMHVVLSLTQVMDLLYIIPYSLLGLAFSTAYFDTDNICSSIFIHILHNSLSISIILLGL